MTINNKDDSFGHGIYAVSIREQDGESVAVAVVNKLGDSDESYRMDPYSVLTPELCFIPGSYVSDVQW